MSASGSVSEKADKLSVTGRVSDEHWRAESQRIAGWFSCSRHLLSGNGVWFSGGEPNTMPSAGFFDARLRVLIVRLSEYSEVAAGITHSYLYQMAAAVDGCFVDMAFLPPERDEKLLRDAAVPLLTGTTSKMPAGAFDVIAISNSVLQELINLPAMLQFSGLPLTFTGRARQGSPLVILGGSNSFVHSILHGCPGSEADGVGLVDGVVMGDGERVFRQLLEIARDQRSLERPALLEMLADRVPGFYNPLAFRQVFAADGPLTAIEPVNGVFKPVTSSKSACNSDSETFTGGPLLYEGAQTSHVIVSAGCPSFCSFCKESWEQKPYRENSFARVLSAARSLKANMGLREISLMTFNANTCSDIFQLVERLSTMFDRVAIKSQRFDAVVNSPELLDMQFEAGKRTYTCAMEGISERLRTLLQKNLDEQTILAGIDLLLARNMRQMKVFLIATGYETAADIEEFRLFLEKVKGRCQSSGSRPRLTFSFATLFRAPQTPMQFAPVRPTENVLAQLLKNLAAVVETAGFEARISSGPEDALVSEFIAFADRRHTPLLVEASIAQGFRYRGEISRRVLEFWRSALKKRGLRSLAESERTAATVMPWDDIDTGVAKSFLFRTWQNLQSGREIRACIAAPWGGGTCSGCGACPSAAEISHLTAMGPDASRKLKISPPAVKQTTWLLCNIPEKWAFCSRDFIRAALARRLMLDFPELVDAFLSVDLVEPDFFAWGQAIARVNFSAAVKLALPVPATLSPDDICPIKVVSPAKKAEETAFPVQLEAAGTDAAPDPSVARDIDALLTRYALKNQKQRANGWLNWQINPGQARKAGLEKISLDENTGRLRLTLIRWPELFLLNKLAASRPLHTTLPSLKG